MQRLRLSKLFVELRWHPSPVLIRMILWELGLPVAAHLIRQLQHALKHPELLIMQIRLRTGDWQFYDMSKVYKSIISNNKRGFMDFGRVEPNWQAWQAFLYPHHHSSTRPVSGKDAGNLNNHKKWSQNSPRGHSCQIPRIFAKDTWHSATKHLGKKWTQFTKFITWYYTYSTHGFCFTNTPSKLETHRTSSPKMHGLLPHPLPPVLLLLSLLELGSRLPSVWSLQLKCPSLPAHLGRM